MIGYFESISLLNEYRKNMHMDYMLYNKPLANYNFFILEPVQTTFTLDKTTVEEFSQKSSKQKENSLKVIVFDSSLLGSYFDFSILLDRLGHIKNLILINSRSGLKLDQQGMEFSNCGLLDVYLNESLDKLKGINYLLDTSSNDFNILYNKIITMGGEHDS
ncbi:hypothetical protein ACWOFR_04255 [Carnobacterium gallinarum]|uniref:hypothetical protein n=1 Tax=Carnobacterium gallinarum TaxID=2749 RepID=UPI000554BFEE|nr:hypothetical protein [Carnobacterium gallinarum]